MRRINSVIDLINFLKHPDSNIIVLPEYLYNLLLTNKWNCPLESKLLEKIADGLVVYKG